MEKGLLWTSGLMSGYWNKADGGGQRPLEYRAPSWSWASLDVARFKFPLTLSSQCHPLDFIVNVGVELVTDDPFGQVESAYLRVKGKLSKITFEKNNQAGEGAAQPPKRMVLSRPNQSYVVKSNPLAHMDLRGTDFISTPDLYFFQLVSGVLKDGSISFCRGLILHPTGLAQGQFERYGLLKFYCPEDDTHGLLWSRDSFKKS